MGVFLDSPGDRAAFDPPSALDIATIEGFIVKRLDEVLDNVEVIHYPDRPEAYRLTHRVGAVLVRYDGATYGPVIDAAAVVQKRELRFATYLLIRDLGWGLGGVDTGRTSGAYSLLESLRTALTGYQIPGCSKLCPVNERFVERDKQGGVWVYESIFSLTTTAVEASVPDRYPLFVQGIALEQGGETSAIAQSAHYTFNSVDQIELAQGNIQNLTVKGLSGSPVYALNSDYSLDVIAGVVTRIPGGAIPAGAEVAIAYSYSDVVTALATGGAIPTAPTN